MGTNQPPCQTPPEGIIGFGMEGDMISIPHSRPLCQFCRPELLLLNQVAPQLASQGVSVPCKPTALDRPTLLSIQVLVKPDSA